MPARILPADSELVAMSGRGMTHADIANEVQRRTGMRVTRAAVSVALMRAGEAKETPRHADTIPWTVGVKHSTEYPVRMLRLLGRRRAGLAINKPDAQRLDGWLRDLDRDNMVVGYCPDVPDGEPALVYLPAEAKDHDDDIPIRREPVDPRQIGY